MKPEAIEIRAAEASDRPILIEFYLKLLQSLERYDHDILPTQDNAVHLVDDTFLPAARRGEPILIAWQGEQAVGAIFWVIQDSPLQLRWKQAVGYGTYVAPEWRRQKIGYRLRQAGFKVLKAKGVQVLFGVANAGNKGGLESTRHKGAIHYGTLVRVNVDEMV